MDISAVQTGLAQARVDTVAPQKQASTPEVKNKSPEPTKDEVAQATKKLQEFANSQLGQIEFSSDESSGQEVMKVVDRTTHDVLMQFPSKEAIALAQDLGKKSGNLIQQKA